MSKAIYLFSCTSLILIFASSCKRTQKCECKTTWETYEFGMTQTHEDITSYPVKGTKKENKTQCDIIKSGLPQEDGFYSTCEVKN